VNWIGNRRKSALIALAGIYNSISIKITARASPIHSYAGIHVQDFPVQAVLRGRSAVSYETDCVAVLNASEAPQRVFACNAVARCAGITAGMTKTQAEAASNVKLVKRVKDKEESAHLALMDCGYSVSHYVEATSPGTILIDLTGTERLLGAPEHIGKMLIDRAGHCGLKVDVALAANPDTALCAARGFSGITVIAPGTEARRLAALPVRVLPLEAEITDALEDWGIRDLGSLARLPVLPLMRRLGQAGVYLQRLARGEIQRPLIPSAPIARFQESAEFEEPLDLLGPLIRVLDSLLQQLIARLKMRALATECLQIGFELAVHADRQLKSGEAIEGGTSSYQRTLKLPAPTQDVYALLKLLELDLTKHPPQSAVKKVMMEAVPARIRSAQSGLFERRAPEAEDLEITLAKLRAGIGERDKLDRGRVGFPILKDSHMRDRIDILAAPSEVSIPYKGYKYRNSTGMAIRLFRPSLPAKVELTDNIPVAVIFGGTRMVVVNASGPWLRSDRWWNKTKGWNCDEWDVELNISGRSKGLYRIVCDCDSGQWLVDGMYS
jgi:protein ImuB